MRAAYLREFRHQLAKAARSGDFALDAWAVGLALVVLDFPLDGECVVAVRGGKNRMKTPGPGCAGEPAYKNAWHCRHIH